VRQSLVDRGAIEKLLLLVGALRSGLIDALDGEAALPVDQLAASAGTDPRASCIVLEALAAEGVVERVVGGKAYDQCARYRLTDQGRRHLVAEGPDLERSSLLHQANKMRGWLQLDEVIRTGRPAARDPKLPNLRAMVCAMGERETEVLDEIVDRCIAYAGAVTTMVDIGGAVGHLTRRFASRGVTATLFDRAATLSVAREFLGDDAATIVMLGGDFTESLPAGQFDLVYFGNVFHIYAPETNARVVREAYAVTAPGGTIAIQDYMRGMSEKAAMFAVNMLRSTESGGVWTEGQYRAWLGDAGFEHIEVQTLDTTGSQLVLARRP
jgi:SAM-dependent methyltransferase